MSDYNIQDFFSRYRILRGIRAAFGLMFSRRLPPKECVILQITKPSRLNSSVHMLFVFQELDIIFLDEDYKIVDMVRLKPFTFLYFPRKAAKYIIETNDKIINKVSIGDTIEWSI